MLDIGKRALKRVLPGSVMAAYRERRKLPVAPQTDRPLSDVFSEIYVTNAWGGKSNAFYSGVGSHEERIVGPYIEAVKRWAEQTGSRDLVAVDVGCGDFAVGSQLIHLFKGYVGVDVVPALVERNQQEYGHLARFVQGDLTQDELPDGDVCFVRQVLQHLSNRQIQAALDRLAKYDYAVLTETHPPNGSFTPNVDIAAGADHRLFLNSGIFLDKPPFNVPPDRLSLLLEVNLGRNEGFVRTYVYRPA